MTILDKKCIAFITPEIELKKILNYSGGPRGQFAGAMASGAFQANLPLVVVSLLYREGYYDQEADDVGQGRKRMRIVYSARDYKTLLVDTGEIISVPVAGAQMFARIKVLPPECMGTVPVIFLDADIPENNYLSRLVTKRLYPSIEDTCHSKEMNDERRITQSILLGFGAVEALKKLGYDALLYHLNDGLAGFTPFALYRQYIDQGIDPGKSFERVRSQTTTTTHAVGLDDCPRYQTEQVDRLLGNQGIFAPFLTTASSDGRFNMMTSALQFSAITNGVSFSHAERMKRMWCQCDDPMATPLIEIPVRVDRNFWQIEDFRHANTPKRLKAAKEGNKYTLVQQVSRETGKRFLAEKLTIVWAHPFTYIKRPKLIFLHHDEIENMLETDQIQLIIIGKPYPDNLDMVHEWNNLARLAEELPNIVVMEELNRGISFYRYLMAGADLWLNTSSAPDDVSYCRWQSAAMNGALNCSTSVATLLDFEEKYYFPFGSKYSCSAQDRLDNLALLQCLTAHAIPMFYDDSAAWYEKALGAKEVIEAKWTAQIMANEYLSRIYKPLLGTQEHYCF